MHHHSLDIDLQHMTVYSAEMAQKVHEQPGEMVPLVRSITYTEGLTDQLESAVLRLARQLAKPADNPTAEAAVEAVPEMQVTLKSQMNMLQFRELTVS